MSTTAGATSPQQTRTTTTPLSPTSPPPAPPQSLAPGPRATALQKVFGDALTHTLKTCSYTNFAACFPTPAKYVPGALDGLHRDFVKRLEEVCRKEFANLMDERQVVPSLNELDQLITDAKRRKERTDGSSTSNEPVVGENIPQMVAPTPPHLLEPKSLISAHLAPFLAAEATSFNHNLEALQSSNRTLIGEIDAQRNEIEMLLNGLEGVVRDLEGAREVFVGDEMSGIEAEIERNFAVGKRTAI